MNEKQLRNDLIKLAKAHPGQVREALLPLIKAYDDCCDGVPEEEQCDECDDDKEASLKTSASSPGLKKIWRPAVGKIQEQIKQLEEAMRDINNGRFGSINRECDAMEAGQRLVSKSIRRCLKEWEASDF